MSLKKYIQLMSLMALPIFVLVVGSLKGQYLGSQRPWTGQQSADSLGKKADTTVTNQLQAAVDSTQDTLDVVYADVNANRTSIDSVADSLAAVQGQIINKNRVGTDDDIDVTVDGDSLYLEYVGSGGGGGGAVIDTTYYDYIIGWNPQDSALYKDFSGWINLNGAASDSVGGDTLVWCIQQLEAGGNIMILSGDSIHVFLGDSVSAELGDTITGLIHINGLGKHQSIITGVDNASGYGGLYFNRAFNGGKLVFKDLGIIWTSALEVPDGYGAVVAIAYNTNVEFDHCFLFRKAVTATGIKTTGPDTSLVYNDCELDELMTYYQSGGSYKWWITHNNCKGYIYYDKGGYSTSCQMRKSYNNCDLWVRNFGRTNDYKSVYITITGCTFRRKEGGVNELMCTNGLWTRIQGSTFWFSTTSSDPTVELWYGTVTGCTFYDGGVKVSGGYASIQGCHFLSAPIGVNVDKDYVSIQGCRFESNTTAIDIAAGADSCVVMGNVGVNNTTDINGTPRTNTDNHWF